jgi:hypothetical protein
MPLDDHPHSRLPDIRAVHAVRNPVRIRVVANAAEARRALRGGYCPVECGFGDESVVCRLKMDHHGPLHHLPGVAIRAYTENFGQRGARPWFAVTGYADEDATWAIAALAGLLPHPTRRSEFRRAPREIREAWTRDWTPLAQLINRVDTDAAPIDLTESRDGRIMLLWRLRSSLPLRDSICFYAGIDRWRELLTRSTDNELDHAGELLRERLTRIRSVRHQRMGRDVVLIDSSIWGYATPYAWEWFEHLDARVLFVFQPRSSGRGIVTVCARDHETAEELFGPGGLLNLYPRLRPPGWGGRPAIGGSHRATPLTWNQAQTAARAAARAISKGS